MSVLEQAAAELVVAMKRLDEAHVAVRESANTHRINCAEFDAAETCLHSAREAVLKAAEAGR